MGSFLKNTLVGELYKFGLNPEDWHIEKDQSLEDEYLLVHRMDPDFQMRGSVAFRSEENFQWSEIKIAGI
jgi:hypothetical protein